MSTRYDPYRIHRCKCGHLDSQHGIGQEHPAERPGCWWCPPEVCTELRLPNVTTVRPGAAL